jgi:hypothetical protein
MTRGSRRSIVDEQQEHIPSLVKHHLQHNPGLSSPNLLARSSNRSGGRLVVIVNERDKADRGIEADDLIELEALTEDDSRRVVSDSGLGRIIFREDRLVPLIPRSMISSLSAFAILDARPRRPNPS